MPLDYTKVDPEERLERIERELWLWRAAGLISIILGMMLFTAGLWALHRAGLY